MFIKISENQSKITFFSPFPCPKPSKLTKIGSKSRKEGRKEGRGHCGTLRDTTNPFKPLQSSSGGQRGESQKSTQMPVGNRFAHGQISPRSPAGLSFSYPSALSFSYPSAILQPSFSYPSGLPFRSLLTVTAVRKQLESSSCFGNAPTVIDPIPALGIATILP